MKKTTLSKAALGRLPMYLNYIRAQSTERISSAEMARVLGLGEVMVRKDMNCVCDQGRPKIGYPRCELIKNLEALLGAGHAVPVAVVGAGKLGRALMGYRGFSEFGLNIVAGFDSDPQKLDVAATDCPVLPMDRLEDTLAQIGYTGVRGMEAVKEAEIPYEGKTLKIAVVSGLGNAEAVLEKIASGEAHYDLVEVMACPGGCVSGAGQPYIAQRHRVKRGEGLYRADSVSAIKRSQDNPLMKELYGGLLKGREHELLHVEYLHQNSAGN